MGVEAWRRGNVGGEKKNGERGSKKNTPNMPEVLVEIISSVYGKSKLEEWRTNTFVLIWFMQMNNPIDLLNAIKSSEDLYSIISYFDTLVSSEKENEYGIKVHEGMWQQVKKILNQPGTYSNNLTTDL